MKSNKLRNVVLTFVGIAVFAAAAIAWQTEKESPGPLRVKLDPNAKYSRPSDDELRQRLTPLQYRVTQQEGTESPFSNEYWDNKEEGIYVDIASGEPLFSSKEKYKSGTGWPSFFKPLVDANVTEHADYSLLGKRTEVRSLHGDSHLGHVFNDGPNPTGLRYCINSAALKFVPVESLESEGYGEFKSHFE